MEQQNKNTNKLTDKAFSRLMLTSVLGILVCIMCLCSATWAWFADGTTSAGNSITSGSFDLDVSVVQMKDGDGVTTQEGENGVWKCTLPGEGTYEVKLTRTDDSTANGYCYVTVGSDAPQPTVTIIDGKPLTFTITVTESTDVTVTFEPRWGIHAEPLIDYASVENAQNTNE